MDEEARVRDGYNMQRYLVNAGVIAPIQHGQPPPHDPEVRMADVGLPLGSPRQ